jgi:hypothetical protein
MDEEGENVIVASFPKNNREVICVGVSEYKGKNLIFVRAFSPTLDHELVPTRDGISLAMEKCDELVQGVRALGDVMSSDKVVARIKKNSIQEVWIGTNTFKDIPLIFIRIYAAYGGEEFKPTKQGVSMRVDLFPKLLEAVEKLAEAVSSLK